MDAALSLSPTAGIKAACDFPGVSRASLYRNRPVLGPAIAAEPPAPPLAPPTPPPRALSPSERAEVLDILHEDRFQDRAPAAIHATLLDEGRYACSVRTMYRILHEQHECRQRRDQLVHPVYQKPELLATRRFICRRISGCFSLLPAEIAFPLIVPCGRFGCAETMTTGTVETYEDDLAGNTA